MSQKNLDLVHSIYADWERGEFSKVDWADAAIEYVIVGGPTPGTWRGRDGMADAWSAFLGAWEGYTGRTDTYRELDDGRALVFLHLGGRGRTSRVDVAQLKARAANLFEIRDDRVTRLVVYLEPERALADLGLEE